MNAETIAESMPMWAPASGWKRSTNSPAGCHKVANEVISKTFKVRECSFCGTTRGVDVHHLNKDISNNSIENLKYLCRSCHMRSHRGIAV